MNPTLSQAASQDEQKSLKFPIKNARSYPEKHCFTE